MNIKKALIALKGRPWIIVFIHLMLVSIVLMVGYQSYKATEDVRSLIRTAHVKQFILISIIIIMIFLGSSYALATSYRDNKTLKKKVDAKTQEFKESHQRLLTVLDSLAAGVYVADMETY